MASFRIPSAFFVLLLAVFVSNTAGLKCYQCFYAADLPGGGGDIEGVRFGKDCQKGKDIPEKWSVECDNEANVTCANAQGTIANLKVWARGCFPKMLVPSDGKCDPNSLKTVVDYISSEFLNGTAIPGINGSLNTCYCDDNDNCNGAISLVPSATLLLFPFLTALSIFYKVSLSF